jgi:hypothetical protein
MTETARQRAEQSISTRFTRLMNATTSPLGVLTDPSMVGLAIAPFFVALVASLRMEAAPTVVMAFQALAAAPLVVAVAVTLGLMGARARVVAWLAELPFPLENVNAVLNGLGESLEITFAGEAPEIPALNASLERISPECFVSLSGPEGDAPPGPRWIEVRIGVVDSKRNPSGSNHARYRRVRALATEILAPLSATHPITEVRVK